jgi:hypothetical protein
MGTAITVGAPVLIALQDKLFHPGLGASWTLSVYADILAPGGLLLEALGWKWKPVVLSYGNSLFPVWYQMVVATAVNALLVSLLYAAGSWLVQKAQGTMKERTNI